MREPHLNSLCLPEQASAFDLMHGRISQLGSLVLAVNEGERVPEISTSLDRASEGRTDKARDREFYLNQKFVSETASLMIVLDQQANIVSINSAVENLTRFKSKDLIGKSFWHCGILDEEELPKQKECLRKISAGQLRVHCVVHARDKSGKMLVLDIHYLAIMSQAQALDNILITAIDITEQHQLQQHLMEAQEHEHSRIGHDLHDGVGQMLSGIGTLTESLQSELQGQQKEDAARIHHLIRETMHQVRRLSHSMSPLSIQNRDLAASLLLLAESIRMNFRRDCVTHFESDLPITDVDVIGHLFRIAQESASNAIRHGAAKEVRLSLRRGGLKEGILEIANDGEPFDCDAGSGAEGIGLRVMKHRANLIQASLQISCPTEGGVLVSCRFPLVLKKSPQPKQK